jgi:DNA-binding Lrp family transcriptional regulator
VSVNLNELQKKLCTALQAGLPLCSRPFDRLAEALDSDEQTVLRHVRRLKELGVLRRLRAVMNYRALGFAGTLVAAHVPQDDVEAVAAAVNSLNGVSHNYLRRHHYNIWFTLQARSPQEIERTLADLGRRLGIEFHSLPVERVFKLDVRFDIEDEARPVPQNAATVPKNGVIQLSENEKRILAKLEKELDLTAKPFDFLCGQGLDERAVLEIVAGLVGKGVIRRVAGILDQRELGLAANVMFCCHVSPERIVEAAGRLARFPIVSHCYQRSTFGGWPYNLFAMMHASTMADIHRAIDEFVKAEGITSFELLPTIAELKKQPVRYDLGGNG